MFDQVELMSARLQVACHGAAHDAYSNESDFTHSDLFSVVFFSIVVSGCLLVYFMVGIWKSAPARIPVGQREVTVFNLV